MNYRLQLPTAQDLYLHLMVLCLLFVSMGDYSVIFSKEVFGNGFVFTKENLKYLVPLTVFCLLFFTHIYRQYKSFRPWLFVYSFVLFFSRLIFF